MPHPMNPARRIARAAKLLDEIEALLAGMPTTADLPMVAELRRRLDAARDLRDKAEWATKQAFDSLGLKRGAATYDIGAAVLALMGGRK